MPGVDYLDMVQIIGDYYGTGSDAYRKFALGNLSSNELIRYIEQVPGAHVTFSNHGNVLGYDYDFPFSRTYNPVAAVDSNVPNSSYGGASFNGRVNGTYQWDGATQTGRFTSGARSVSTGARVATVASKINTAVMAVSAGMWLGAKIDSALYNAGKFFNLNPPQELNPATWDSIATTEGGQQLLRTLFHIDDNGGTTMYMPEDALDYMYRYWVDKGLFGGDTGPYIEGTISGAGASNITIVTQPVSYVGGNTITTYKSNGMPDRKLETNATSSIIFIAKTSPTTYNPHIVSESPFTGTITFYNADGSVSRTSNVSSSSRNSQGLTTHTISTLSESFASSNPAMPVTNATMSGAKTGWEVYYIKKYGNNTTISSAPEGITPQTGATMPDPNNIDPANPVIPQLQQQYPQMFGNPIKETVPQPDGTNKDIVYYPVPWPATPNETDDPVTGLPTQIDPTVTPTNPTDETDPLRDVITNPLPQPSTPTPGPTATPPSTGGGSSPTVTQPSGEASSLWAVYNPTQAQLDAFGAWLWSSNFVDQIKKLFNDPMQAIVGVHKVFATPSTGSQVNIKCGYIDSECPAAQVTSQYTTVDCGAVNVREYYGNVLDYAPYTDINLYLPFIGIVKLDVADVMRGSVHVKYHVDVITGACLADVIVKRDGESAVLYQYAGSAIVTYPVSSGSYASMVTGVLSLAAGVAGTIMTGGAAAPALIGGAVGLSHLHTDVQKSGGFSGSPGAMGGKKPYLIISRPQDATPTNFEKYEGKPASKTVVLGNCSGFVKVKQINIDAVPATYGEQDQIVALLKQGVIL